MAAALSNKCSPMAGHPINLCFWGKNDGVALDSLPFRRWRSMSTAYDYAGYEHKFHLSGISCFSIPSTPLDIDCESVDGGRDDGKAIPVIFWDQGCLI